MVMKRCEKLRSLIVHLKATIQAIRIVMVDFYLALNQKSLPLNQIGCLNYDLNKFSLNFNIVISFVYEF